MWASRWPRARRWCSSRQPHEPTVRPQGRSPDRVARAPPRGPCGRSCGCIDLAHGIRIPQLPSCAGLPGLFGFPVFFTARRADIARRRVQSTTSCRVYRHVARPCRRPANLSRPAHCCQCRLGVSCRDKALDETIIGLYQAEATHHCGPWRSLEAAEYATRERVDWFKKPPAARTHRQHAPGAEPEMQPLQQQSESAIPA